jgi:hypothetical protein
MTWLGFNCHDNGEGFGPLSSVRAESMGTWNMKKALLIATAAVSFAYASSAMAAVSDKQDAQAMLTGGPFTWVAYFSVLNPPSRCVTATEGGQVNLSICDGGRYQMWSHSQNQLGDEIRNVQSDLCLQGGSPSSPSVTTQACNGGNAQRWVLTQDRLGWSMRNVSTGYCLDTNGSAVLQIYCGLGDPARQRWIQQ